MQSLADNYNITIKTEFESVFLLNGVFSECLKPFLYPINEALYITVLPLEAQLLPYTIKTIGAKALCNPSLAQFDFDPRSHKMVSNLADSAAAKRARGLAPGFDTFYNNNITITLLPRYNYIYDLNKAPNFTKSENSTSANNNNTFSKSNTTTVLENLNNNWQSTKTVAEKLFYAIKQNDFATAKNYCTQNLLNTITEQDLKSFFKDFISIEKAAMPLANTQSLSIDNSYSIEKTSTTSAENNNNTDTTENYYLITHTNTKTLYTFELKTNLIDNILEL